jgi:hypothetical protein
MNIINETRLGKMVTGMCIGPVLTGAETKMVGIRVSTKVELSPTEKILGQTMLPNAAFLTPSAA